VLVPVWSLDVLLPPASGPASWSRIILNALLPAFSSLLSERWMFPNLPAVVGWIWVWTDAVPPPRMAFELVSPILLRPHDTGAASLSSSVDFTDYAPELFLPLSHPTLFVLTSIVFVSSVAGSAGV